MITSSSNPQIRYIQQLAKKSRLRAREGVFLIEGIRMFSETPRERMVKAYLSESFYESLEDKDLITDRDWELVSDSVFRTMSETLHPQGVLALVRQQAWDPETLMKKKDPLFVVLEKVQDPGNMGTIIRTAEGAGAAAVIMSSDCVDIYNPKTVRSTMGSIYRMPLIRYESEDLRPLLAQMKSRGIASCAAHLQGTRAYDREDYTGGTAFLIGNEGNGLSPELAEAADKKVLIPMEGSLESLNAAVAAAILMYEAQRQRRDKSV